VTSKKNYKRPLHPYRLIRSANLNNFNENIFTSESMEKRLNVIADRNIGCVVKVVYEPPEDGHIKGRNIYRGCRIKYIK
jgi:hypothetical protein